MEKGKMEKKIHLVFSHPLKTHPTPTKPKPPILPTIQINKTAFYPAPQKTLGVLQKISPVFAKTKK
jgi:hypothetical protein